jgi:prepilin-type N-terminal cleavage/methylation domain-containing protein
VIKRRKGFTLIELMVVASITILLTAVSVATYSAVKKGNEIRYLKSLGPILAPKIAVTVPFTSLDNNNAFDNESFNALYAQFNPYGDGFAVSSNPFTIIANTNDYGQVTVYSSSVTFKSGYSTSYVFQKYNDNSTMEPYNTDNTEPPIWWIQP